MNTDALFCRKCGREIPGDSDFCCYCGAKVVTLQREPTVFDEMVGCRKGGVWSTPPAPNTYQVPRQSAGKSSIEPLRGATPYQSVPDKTAKKRFFLRYAGIALLLIVAICIVVVSNISRNPSGDSPSPVQEPYNGQILSVAPQATGGDSSITVKTSSEATVVKLKDSYGTSVKSFYVQANSTVTVAVPSQRYYVYFASGEVWYGNALLFGEDTHYSKDDDIQDFSSYTISYTLYPVTNGNFQETPIDASEF